MTLLDASLPTSRLYERVSRVIPPFEWPAFEADVEAIYFRSSPQCVIGVLPLEKTGLENNPVFCRSRVMVIPPIAMSKLFASRSDLSVGQLVFTMSSLTPSDCARLIAMSTSMPSTVPDASANENGR